MQAIDPEIEGLPYWDLSIASPSIFSAPYMGAATGAEVGMGDCDSKTTPHRRAITDGPFAYLPVPTLAEANLDDLNFFAEQIYPKQAGQLRQFDASLYSQGYLRRPDTCDLCPEDGGDGLCPYATRGEPTPPPPSSIPPSPPGPQSLRPLVCTRLSPVQLRATSQG